MEWMGTITADNPPAIGTIFTIEIEPGEMNPYTKQPIKQYRKDDLVLVGIKDYSDVAFLGLQRPADPKWLYLRNVDDPDGALTGTTFSITEWNNRFAPFVTNIELKGAK